MLACKLDQGRTVSGRGIRIVHDDGAARTERGLDELGLAAATVLVVAEEILANVLVCSSEALAVEGALPRSLQADEDDEIQPLPDLAQALRPPSTSARSTKRSQFSAIRSAIACSSARFSRATRAVSWSPARWAIRSRIS